MAGGKVDERGGVARVVNRVGNLPGAHPGRVAVLGFKFDLPRAAMSRQIEHMAGLAAQFLTDLVEAANLENANMDVAVSPRPLNSVENRLQLALGIEDNRSRLALVGRAHGDQNLERPGLGLLLAFGRGVPAQHAQPGLERRGYGRPAVRPPQTGCRAAWRHPFRSRIRWSCWRQRLRRARVPVRRRSHPGKARRRVPGRACAARSCDYRW